MSQIKKIEIIALNRKAHHDYFIETQLEAGLILEGWEVKSLRAGRAQIDHSYILIRNNSAWLLGALITPLSTTSIHSFSDPQRTRKLLLKQSELNKLLGYLEQKGYTLIGLKLYWKSSRHAKLTIGLAKGKKLYDKRATIKQQDWNREKERLQKKKNLI